MPGTEDRLMEALHEEHAAALWSYCVRLTDPDRARAQDVCQETLLRAWRHPEVLSKPSGALRGWLFTVARNIVIDEWRSRRAHPETVTDEVPEPLDRVDETDRLLQTWVVEEALGRLSPDHREVLRQCYFHGRSVAEAAQRLDLPEGTVKSRTHYALKALRLALDELGVTG